MRWWEVLLLIHGTSALLVVLWSMWEWKRESSRLRRLEQKDWN